MALGKLRVPPIVQLADIPVRTTDMSMELFTPFVRPFSIDMGAVTREKHFSVYFWNGASSPVTVDYAAATGDVGGLSYTPAAPFTIPAVSATRVDFTVGTEGPLFFSATYYFLGSAAYDPEISIYGTRPVTAFDLAPLPITLDAAIAEAYVYQDPGETFYDTLEFTEMTAGSGVRIVHSDEDLNTPQGLFSHCRFGCKHPETEGGTVGVMQITVDYLPIEAQNWLMQTCKARGNVTVYWRQYLGPNRAPDAHYPVPLSVTSVEQTSLGVTVSASFPMLTTMKFPRRLMTTSVLPGAKI